MARSRRRNGPFSWFAVRILRPIIHPAARFLLVGVANDLHRRAVGSEFVGHQYMRRRCHINSVIGRFRLLDGT